MVYELPPGVGSETVTTGSACARVFCWSRLLFEARVAIPPPTTMTAMAMPTTAAMRSPRWRAGGLEPSGDMRFSNCGHRSAMRTAAEVPVHDAEHHRNENQSGEGCEGKSTNHGTAERRVLLAAFTQAQRHRYHADDHGKRGHQHWTEAYESGLEGCGERIAVLIQLL